MLPNEARTDARNGSSSSMIARLPRQNRRDNMKSIAHFAIAATTDVLLRRRSPLLRQPLGADGQGCDFNF
jgi:hypothetical protein